MKIRVFLTLMLLDRRLKRSLKFGIAVNLILQRFDHRPRPIIIRESQSGRIDLDMVVDMEVDTNRHIGISTISLLLLRRSSTDMPICRYDDMRQDS